MKVKVWVKHNWSRHQGECELNIISDKEYQKRQTKEIEKEYNDKIAFADWLEYNYNTLDIWNLTCAEKEAILAGWREACVVSVDENSEWNCYEIEI